MKTILAAIIVAAGFTLGAGDASAASACKGLSSNKCEGATACYWVKGYKTKAGSNVKAHCRSKPKSGAASKSSSSKSKSTAAKATSTKDSDKNSKKSSPPSNKKSTDKKKASKKKKQPTS